MTVLGDGGPLRSQTGRPLYGERACRIRRHGDLEQRRDLPLRLHEARAALFGAIPKAAAVEAGSIRTAAANFRDHPVACVLLFPRRDATSTDPGRHWEETEECVDPETRLLQIHSQVPGHYYAYHNPAAVEAAKRVVVSPPAGSPPEQHFVFVIENFPVPQ